MKTQSFLATLALAVLLAPNKAVATDYDAYPPHYCDAGSNAWVPEFDAGAYRCNGSGMCYVYCPIIHNSDERKPSTISGVNVDLYKATVRPDTLRVCAGYGSGYSCTSDQQTELTTGYQTVSFSSDDLQTIQSKSSSYLLYVYVSLYDCDDKLVRYFVQWN